MLTQAQQLANRYFLAYKDMQDADRYLAACAKLAELQEAHGGSIYFDHCEGLLIAAIVAYCRPFMRNKSKDYASALIRPDQISSLTEYADLHELLLEKRNTFVAHSDWVARSTQVVRIEEDGAVLRQAPIPSVTKGIDLHRFGRLIAAVGIECRNQAYQLDTTCSLN